MTIRQGVVLALFAIVVLALPVLASGQLPTANVTVCQVTGSANAPKLLEVSVSVSEVAAYLNQYPGSFVGSCPASGGGGGGAGSNPPVNGAVTVCRVTGSASAPIVSEVLVSADDVAVFLNQNPGSFVGGCPTAPGGGNAGGSTSKGGKLSALVTVCRVSGDVNAPQLVQLTLKLEQVAAFLNQNPRAFVGTCPGQGGAVTQGPGRILGIPVGAALTICQVTTSAGVARLAQANVAIDRVAAFLNQHPGSFVGLCPSSADPNGTLGNEPLGYLTICRITGDVNNPLAPVTIRVEQLNTYLARAGTIAPAPTSGCPRTTSTTTDGESSPTSSEPGQSSTVVVSSTPNTVVTAKGAGVNEHTRTDKNGKAKLKLKPKRAGIITVRGTNNRIVKRIGVASQRNSGANLTG